MKMLVDNILRTLIIVAGVAATLVISPGLGYDPINLPKMLVLITCAGALLVPTIMGLRSFMKQNTTLVFLTSLFVVFLLLSLLFNTTQRFQQLWGTWGRSTGFITYLAFIIIMVAGSKVSSPKNMEDTRIVFERLSYFVSFYTLLQAGDLDPINWSQKSMIATLGNINFMSSFLGLATVSFFIRIIWDEPRLSSRLYFGSLSLLNLWLIWISNSIQGLGIYLVGVSVAIAFKLRETKGFGVASSFVFLTSIAGGFVFAGTLGIGPIARFKQETVIYRLDYWLAGLRMLQENWLNGVGIDSYGDFYTQYRDIDAITRTGPQRVTNTAHNIFLDVATGSGIFAGLVFMAIFVLASWKVFCLFSSCEFSSSQVTFSSLFFGFLVFCLISINQIGVGVWGFIFMGMVLGISKNKEKRKSAVESFAKRPKRHPEEFERLSQSAGNLSGGRLLLSVLLTGASFCLAFIPNAIDAKMLRAVQTKDFSQMKILAYDNVSATFHRNKYLSLLLESGMETEALEFAKYESDRNNRNEFAWRMIAFRSTEFGADRLQAINALKQLDPLNSVLLAELGSLGQ